jgi:predicted NBD/HSP70 family sugar kinase
MLATTEKANQTVTKRHNARLVLKTIYDHEPLSRADIARLTELTATTVSHLIAELIAEGVVTEIGSAVSERGKPPTLVGLGKNAQHVIALNLAQNVFRGGVLNLRGEVLYQQSYPAEHLHGEAALDTVYQLVGRLLTQSERPLLGIGVGAPGMIDAANGVIRRAVNLQWHNLPLAQLLGERYGLPIYIINDNQAALLAEWLFGRYRNVSDLVMVRVGRGIGAAIMINRQLIHNQGAGEIGHVVVAENGERCSCGNAGCLETVASSRAIVQQARQLAAQQPGSLLAAKIDLGDELDIQTVIAAWQAGDVFLEPVLDDLAKHLGTALAHLVSLLGPVQILLSGSVTGFGEPLLARVRMAVERRSLTAQLHTPAIDLATLSTDIIMLGATALLLQHELGLF